MTPQQREQTWQAAIEKTRSMVQVKSTNQMLIAEIAMSVCEISWGGNVGKHQYTIKRFAKETNLNEKSISHWIAVRKIAYNQLPVSLAKKISFTKLSHIASASGRDATRKLVMEKYEEIVNVDAFDSKIKRQIYDLRTVHHNFVLKNAALKCNKETLQEILFYTLAINREILKEHPGLLPKSHGIGAMRLRNTSAAAAMNIPRHRGEKIAQVKTDLGEVKITPKDRDVAQFLEKAATFVSPTDIGMKLHGHNRNNASAWACRSLDKLVAIGLVERNTYGKYRWK